MLMAQRVVTQSEPQMMLELQCDAIGKASFGDRYTGRNLVTEALPGMY
jgi:hypothetical protein